MFALGRNASVMKHSVSGVDITDLEVHMIKRTRGPLVQWWVEKDQLDKLVALSGQPEFYHGEPPVWVDPRTTSGQPNVSR